MASGFITGGVDLDAKFKAGSGGSNTGFQVAGVDLSARYAPRVTAPIANTGFVSGGSDLANRFENIGGAAAQVQTATYERATSPVAISFNNNGTFTKNVNTSGPTYNWLIGGAVADFDLRVTPSSGTFSAGTINTWIPLTTSRGYERSAGGLAQTVIATAEIRHNPTGTITSGVITLVCDPT